MARGDGRRRCGAAVLAARVRVGVAANPFEPADAATTAKSVRPRVRSASCRRATWSARCCSGCCSLRCSPSATALTRGCRLCWSRWGATDSFAALSVSIFSFGGIVAALGVGLLIDRFGAMRTLISLHGDLRRAAVRGRTGARVRRRTDVTCCSAGRVRFLRPWCVRRRQRRAGQLLPGSRYERSASVGRRASGASVR